MDQKGKHKNLSKSKLIRLLSQMESYEIKQFKAQIKAKGTKSSDAHSVLLYLCALHPSYTSEQLNYKVVYKEVFPTQPFNYQKLMKVVSHAHSELKQFLILETLQKDAFLSDYLLAKIYAEKQLSHDLSLLLTKKQNTPSTLSDPQYFLEQWHWSHLQYYSDSTTKIHQEEDVLFNAMISLDWYYLGNKLKYACDLLTRGKIMGKEVNINFFATIQSYCAKHKDQLPLFHQLYYLAWQLIEFQREVDYFQLKKLFFEGAVKVAKEDQLILLTYLLNFSFYKFRENNTSFLQEAYDLYQFGMEKDILVIDKLFVDDHFINLISVCSALKKFDWIESLLAKKLAPLIKDLAPSAYHLAMARLSFAKEDFIRCRGYLMGIDHTIYGHSFRARTFQIACAFELKEPVHTIESHCKSYENYLRRHSTIHKQNTYGGLNFISMVRKLIKIKPNKTKLEAVLQNYDFIVFQPWLAIKISELK